MASDDDLRAVEELNARYCRTLDLKEWAAFRSVFADDFVSDTSASGGMVIEGADTFVEFVQRMPATAVTVHQVQQPEIELTSPVSATGIWAMLDVVRFAPGLTLHGFGHYIETYEKVDGDWRIKTSTLNSAARRDPHPDLLDLRVGQVATFHAARRRAARVTTVTSHRLVVVTPR